MKTESKGKPTIVRKLFKNEVKCLTKCKHDNIWKLIDFSEKSTFQHSSTKTSVAFIALEYAENGEIFDFILDTGRFSEPVARYYFKQLISALECIHDKGYAHRDIKPENILLDKTGNLKLADFTQNFTSKVSFECQRWLKKKLVAKVVPCYIYLNLFLQAPC